MNKGRFRFCFYSSSFLLIFDLRKPKQHPVKYLGRMHSLQHMCHTLWYTDWSDIERSMHFRNVCTFQSEMFELPIGANQSRRACVRVCRWKNGRKCAERVQILFMALFTSLRRIRYTRLFDFHPKAAVQVVSASFSIRPVFRCSCSLIIISSVDVLNWRSSHKCSFCLR